MSIGEETGASAWNPGLQSDIPARLWPSVTLFQEANATISYQAARELADLTGLKVLELAALKPERLVVHALLVRVTADLSVADGPNYEELGINLRGMVHRIYSEYMLPEMERIVALFSTDRDRATEFIERQLSAELFKPSGSAEPEQKKQSLFKRLFGGDERPLAKAVDNNIVEPVEILAIKAWKQQAEHCEDPLHLACLETLAKSVDTIVGRRGRVINDAPLIANIIVNQVSNVYGAAVIEDFIEDIWQRAVDKEGYRTLPKQSKPVIMNVKGASASGKSTIRPQQRKLAEKLGTPWEDFALISPDYWRKYLLDYSTLGDDYKYAAMLTGRELEIIDKKLDRYMEGKAARGAMSHLLIDRFRFDSFIVDSNREANSTLLSRFGNKVFLFFMVTHPAETVERAWTRGIKTGRYKAVDDLLFHNVEAFTGMPSLFFSWVNSKDKQIHFEFLDNDVALGELPMTAAFGWNNTLTILDIKLFLNIDRYRKVNVNARQADQVFASKQGQSSNNTDFIKQCAERVSEIIFADQASTEVYARVSNGKLVWWDYDYIQAHAQSEGLLEMLQALGYTGEPCSEMPDPGSLNIDIYKEKRVTVGRWSTSAVSQL